MKRIVLIKTSPSPILAHLYEHLYCRELTELFRSHELMRFVDYSCLGKQYHGGFMHTEVQLYSQAAQRLAQSAVSLDLQFGEGSVSTCLNQIAAEKQRRVGVDMQQTMKSLKALHDQPWTTLDDFVYFDAKSIRRTTGEVWYGDVQKDAFRTLQSTLVLDGSVERRLHPLFHVVAHVLQENIADSLVESFGYYYAGEAKSEYTGKIVREASTLRIDKALVGTLTDELDSIRTDIKTMLKIGLVPRLAQDLRSARYDIAWSGPDELWTYEATDVLVGAAGWRELGTEENIRLVLQNTTLQLSLGRDKRELGLGDIAGQYV